MATTTRRESIGKGRATLLVTIWITNANIICTTGVKPPKSSGVQPVPTPWGDQAWTKENCKDNWRRDRQRVVEQSVLLPLAGWLEVCRKECVGVGIAQGESDCIIIYCKMAIYYLMYLTNNSMLFPWIESYHCKRDIGSIRNIWEFRLLIYWGDELDEDV